MTSEPSRTRATNAITAFTLGVVANADPPLDQKYFDLLFGATALALGRIRVNRAQLIRRNDNGGWGA
ncbi:hypothetical protein [Cryobacterium sp. AP23]